MPPRFFDAPFVEKVFFCIAFNHKTGNNAPPALCGMWLTVGALIPTLIFRCFSLPAKGIVKGQFLFFALELLEWLTRESVSA